MATLSKAESRRLYSWWWDSHISPKNSKWLQENLTDMDSKVKSMIKLIEEDADSFARRAEMYYKKRPELMKLVEEFYRAYRALAERYDHATGALRQAHRTMSEVFPNQIPFALTDESPCITTSAETEPCTPDNLPPTSSFFDSDNLHKDFSSPSSPFHVKKNGAYADDNDDSANTKKGLKQLTDFFSNNGVRKGLNFQEEGNKGSESEKRNGLKDFQKIGRDDEASQKVKRLQEEASKLSDENESLKMQIKSESGERSKAESEFQWLEKVHSKLKSERDEAVQNFEQSLIRISALQTEIENFKAQSSEILAKVSMLENVEEKSVQLEKENFSLKLEIGALEQKSNEQQEELLFKEQELEKLVIVIQDEHMRCVHAEASLESLQTLHAQSLETMKISALEFQNGVQLLKETETKKQLLEKELENVKMEIRNLNDENVSSQLLIKTLQDENFLLKEAQKKLENDVEHQLNVKKSLEEELCRLTKETDDLLHRHKSITDQIEAVGLNEESLHSSVKELQDTNLELKELCKKKENENVLLLKKLNEMKEIIEQNAVLDKSLSESNIELERLRLKIKEVEESCELLNMENLALESEKTVLVSKLDAVMDSLAMLSKKNILLESSLSDSVVELEELRGRLKSLEESCQSLEEEKANLQFESSCLISQVDAMTNNIEDMEKRFTEVHDVASDLEKENKIKDSELTELQNLSDLKRQKYEAFMDASNARLASMESEIHRLQQNSTCREEEFVEEQHKFFSAQIEIFIFQRSICDLKEQNFILSKQWQEMEQYILRQTEKEIALLNRIERLKKVIHMVWRAINTNEDGMLMDGSEELSLQFILDKIKGMQNTACDAEDERQSLLLEKSVYVTLLQQLGHHITDLRLEKNDLYQECRKKTDELLVLENEKRDLIEINSQTRYESEAGKQSVGRLEEEMKLLDRQTLDLKEAHDMSQSENQKLVEENDLLSSKFSNLKEEIHLLEEEYGAIFQRAALLDSLSLVFERLSSDKMSDLKTFNNDLIHSHKINNDLENKVIELAEKSEGVEAENMYLKDLALKLKQCRDQLTILVVDMSMARTVNEELSGQIEQLDQLIENRNSSLMQKDIVLSEADWNVQNLQGQNEQHHGNLEGIKLELGEIKVVRDGLEKKIAIFLESMANKEKEIALALEANKILAKELQRLDKENGDLRRKERESTTVMLDEVNCCEKEFAGLCNDIQVANVHAALFEEKVLDLMRVCECLETRNLVEREASNGELLSKNSQIEELIARLEYLEEEKKAMKSDLNEYTSIVSSLGNGISSLENLIIPPSKHHTSDYLKIQDDHEKGVSQGKGRDSTGQNDDLKRGVPLGVLELQKILGKIKILQEAIVESGGHLSPSESDGDASKMVASNLYDSGTTSRQNHASATDSTASISKDESIMKDIELDHVSSSSKQDFDGDAREIVNLDNTKSGDDVREIHNLDNTKSDDEMLRVWETTDSDSNKKQNPPFTSGDDANHHLGTKTPEEEKGERYSSSELVAEKELSVDKLEVAKKAKDFHRSWNKEIVEGLSSDSERLTALQKGFEELKLKMERTEGQNIPKSFEYDTIKMQLQDAEASIMLLLDANKKLIDRAEDCSTSSGSNVEEMDEKKVKKRQVTEFVQKGSDKIGRLELELQKLQYILLKLEEEYENHRKRTTDRSSRVLLRDYLYGRRNRRRRRSLCGCFGPTVSDD